MHFDERKLNSVTRTADFLLNRKFIFALYLNLLIFPILYLEVSINYNYQLLGMQKLKVRQDHFNRVWDFTCCCGLCQEEEIKNDDEIYEKFQKLQEQVQKAALAEVETGIQNLDDMEIGPNHFLL